MERVRGVDADGQFRQNTAPLGLNDTWLQPAVLLTSGTLAGAGQQPDYLKAIPRVLERG